MNSTLSTSSLSGCEEYLLRRFNSDNATSGNGSHLLFERPTGINNASKDSLCSLEIPTSAELFAALPPSMLVLCVLLALCTLVTWSVYLEEIYFILKNFRIKNRKNKTIWVLAFAPVFSTTSLLGVFLPRSGPLVDMVANVFFGTCLYNFGGLMISYMGGPKRMWELVGEDRKLELNTPPLCCCCVCLPRPPFTRGAFLVTSYLIMQVAIVRTVLMFVAAVLWADGRYRPGDTSLRNGFVYIATLNLISTMMAIYGLMLTRRVLAAVLKSQFAISCKIAILQATLLFSVVPNFNIGLLVTQNVIGCGAYLPPKGRGEVLYHAILVVIMIPCSLVARIFYRRSSDGCEYAQQTSSRLKPLRLDLAV